MGGVGGADAYSITFLLPLTVTNGADEGFWFIFNTESVSSNFNYELRWLNDYTKISISSANKVKYLGSLHLACLSCP